jgi:hypothetical protein
MDELSGLLTLNGMERRALAGLWRLETPLEAPFRGRVLSGRYTDFVDTVRRKERDVMMLCESSVPRTMFGEESVKSAAVPVPSRVPGGCVSPRTVIRLQRTSISVDLSRAHATKSGFDSCAAAIPGIIAETAETKRKDTINKGVRIVDTFYY